MSLSSFVSPTLVAPTIYFTVNSIKPNVTLENHLQSIKARTGASLPGRQLEHTDHRPVVL
jgi:hypothetical protein